MEIASPTQMTQTISDPTGSPEAFDALSSVDPGGEPVESIEIEGESEEVGSEVSETAEEKVVEPTPEADKGGDPVKDTAPASSEPIKNITFKAGDKTFEIPETAVSKFKVDGKEVEVTQAELQKNYQAKVPWERHYAETKALERQAKNELAQVEVEKKALQATAEELKTAFKKNPFSAFEMIVEEFLKENPADYLPLMIAQAKQTVEDLSKISKAEYDAYLISKRTSFEQKKLDRERENLTKETGKLSRDREIAEADGYFNQKAVELGFTEAEVNTATQIIKESGVDLSKATPKDISNMVIDYIQKVERPFNLVDTAIKEFDEKMMENHELKKHLRNLITPDFTKNDIKAILKEYIKDSSPNPEPKAEASQEGKSSKGAGSESRKGNTRAATPKVVSPKASGNDDVGPMSMFDILAEYE